MTTTTVCAGSGIAAVVADGEALLSEGCPVPAEVADGDLVWPAGPLAAGLEPPQPASNSRTTPVNRLAALTWARLAAPAQARPDRPCRVGGQPCARLSCVVKLPCVIASLRIMPL